jgi:multiple antibiotic resistance protein
VSWNNTSTLHNNNIFIYKIMKCKPLYMSSLILIIGIHLSFNLLDFEYITNAETSCLENIEDEKNEIFGININYMTYTNTFTNVLASDAAAEPFQLISTFLDEYGNEILKAVITLFVVIDPIGIIPLFASFTEKMQSKDRKAISQTATITAGVLLFVFAIAGTQIFAIFRIDVFSFMIAGGVLLFIVSIELLTHGAWRFGVDTRNDDSGVVPLAFPLLAGPGAITAVIISYQTSGVIVTIISIAIVIAITYVILLLVIPIYRILGRRGSMVITRVFAVLVAAFAVQYIVEGIKQFYFTTL